MSLTGIRDLTLLHTPPADRQPILTYVGEYDERAVAEAIRRELLREGQVFYVHNRVRDIEKVAAELRALVPEARVAVAHGQMDEGALEQVVLDFWEGALRRPGLHDHHRVGHRHADGEHPRRRPGRPARASASCTSCAAGSAGPASGPTPTCCSRPTRSLSEEAYERLRTIGEHTELGSGFKIAMRDLEIRGAGNLLGGDQSGHIAAVGLRPVRADGGRGGGRAEGRGGPPAGGDQARPARRPPTCPPTTSPGRTSAWRPTGGWRRSPPTPRSTTSSPSGSTATGRCPPPPGPSCASATCGPSAPGWASARWRSSPAGPACRAAASPPGCRRSSSRPASGCASAACAPRRCSRRTSASWSSPCPAASDPASDLAALLAELAPPVASAAP